MHALLGVRTMTENRAGLRLVTPTIYSPPIEEPIPEPIARNYSARDSSRRAVVVAIFAAVYAARPYWIIAIMMLLWIYLVRSFFKSQLRKD